MWRLFKTASLTATERQRLTSFSCVTAQCYKPADRADLLGAIRREWGSEEKVDEFVRMGLVEMLEASKVRCMRQLAMVAGESVQLLLGD